MSDLDTSLAEILNTRFVELFQISLKKPLRPALCAQDQVPFVNPIFHATIGLTGDGIEGQLVVMADKKFLHETHPERRYGGVLDNADYLDWVAEICNRTLAGSKAHIQALGYQLRLEQPQAKQTPAAPVPADTRELIQILESDGFHAVLSLRLKKLEARAPKAS
jgi:hypothetical protein